MRVFVTGGNGFIGSQLVSFLKSKGHDVFLFTGDITDVNLMKEFLHPESADVVMHLAAVVNSRDKKMYERINVLGTENIISLCRRLQVGRIIFLSSLRVVSALKDPYVDSKRRAEEAVIHSGLSYIIVRPSMVYGPTDKKNLGFLLKILREKHFIPAFDFMLQPLFLEDLLRVLDFSLTVTPGKILNVAGSAITFKDFLNIVGNLGYKFTVLGWPRVNYFLLKILSYLPFSSFTPWQVNSLFSKEIFSDQSWLREAGLVETPLKEGLAEILAIQKL